MLPDVVGIDIGGTEIKYGIIDNMGAIKTKDSIPTEPRRGGEALMDKVKGIIYDYRHIYPDIIGIGISSAGQIEPESGSVWFATDNLPGWTGMPIKGILEGTFKLPCYVANDVNAAALGELWRGAAKDSANLVMITLGTGIGGAIVKNGKIFYGANGGAGEFGHIKLYKDGYPCTCGLRGCYEQYASTNALIRLVKEYLQQNNSSILNNVDKIDGKSIFEAEKRGDRLASQAIDVWIEHISWGLSILIHSLNPDTIIIGGGVSMQGEHLINRIRNKTFSMTMPSFIKRLSIKSAQLFNDAGIIGAAYGLLKSIN